VIPFGALRDAGDPAAPSAVLVGPGVVPAAGALDAARALAHGDDALAGGPLADGELTLFGWMLAPEPFGPVRFTLNAVAAPRGEPAGALAGEIDVVAPGVVVVPRALLGEALPADAVAAMVELAARARDAGRRVRVDAALAADATESVVQGDDRGRNAALRDVAERRPSAAGAHRLPAGVRARFVEREIRLGGGRRIRALVARPPLTRLIHGPFDDAAPALRSELRVRGDRYVLVAARDAVPDDATLDALVEALESGPHVAAAAPDAASLEGRCVLLAAGRFPMHLDAAGTTLAGALRTLLDGACALRRSVRVPGMRAAAVPPSLPPRRSASAVILVASAPEVTRITLDAALAALPPCTDAAAVCASGAATARRMLGAYPGMRIEIDDADPLLTGALNRALGAARGDVVYLLADDVLLPPATLERLAAAFARIPALGAACAAVPGAALGEGVIDVEYPDLKAMRAIAERRERERAREAEPIDVAGTPAIAFAREALRAAGGIDPAFGPTRRGIADLVLRVRRAGYAVVRCDDTLVHRFDAGASRSAIALADRDETAPPAPAPQLLARGLAPHERIPFVALAPAPPESAPSDAAGCVLALPVADAAELRRAARMLGAAASAFGAGDPIRVAVLLDGTVSAAEAAAALRPVLAGCGRAMSETIAVRVEREPDAAAWRARLGEDVRLVAVAGLGRAALAGCAVVDDAGVGALLERAAR